MAAVTKNSEGNDAMASEPDDSKAKDPSHSRKVPPSYPTPQKGGGSGVPPTARGTPSGPIPREPRRGFFTIYKKGQGYWTRMGTVAGAILMGLLTCDFLWDQKEAMGMAEHGGYILVGAFGALYALLCFYLLNKPMNVDFLIATDSEMKKVNWTTREELIGSTKVVILFMFAIAVVLFLYDLFFHTIFWLIGVLKTPPPFIPGK